MVGSDAEASSAGEQAPSHAGSAGQLAASITSPLDSQGRPRRRGKGGGKGWRGGPPPQPPALTGTMQHIQGKAFRLWLQKIERWRAIARFYYPENEQGIRLLEVIQDEPAEELQVWTETEGNAYWMVDDGADRIWIFPLPREGSP